MSDDKLLKELRQLLTRKRSKSYYARQLGISEKKVSELLDKIRGKSTLDKTFSEDIKSGTAETSFKTYTEIRTLEELIAKTGIDTEKWNIDKYVQNYWGNSDTPYYQVKAWLSRRKVTESEVIEEMLSSYKSSYIPLKVTQILQNNSYSSKCCAVISLTDFHIDKLPIDKISVEDRVNQYRDVLQNLLYKSYKSHLLDEVVFVLGSDLLHTDSIHNTTTSGTPLYVNMSWNEAYEMAFDLMVESISKVRQFCNKLHVVLVPGNHGFTKEYYMAHALETYFKADKSIIFNRTKDRMKVHVYGETMLGFHHGDVINDKLPLAFSTSFYKEWGKCKYKEILLGDKHYNSEKRIKSHQGEAMGVRMRILPSLSPTDDWHDKNLFVNSIQSGICLIYDYNKGKVSEFEESI